MTEPSKADFNVRDYLERAKKREELIERIEAYLKEQQISEKTFEDVAFIANLKTKESNR